MTAAALAVPLIGAGPARASSGPVVAADTLPSGLGYAFGRNDFGQTSPGTTGNQLTPKQLPNGSAGLLSDAVSMAAGNGFVVWADHSGRVWSLGDNSNGEHGNGSVGGTTAPPVMAGGFGGSGQPKAVKVSSYGLAVDVLDSNGEVWQWGQVVNNQSNLAIQSTPSKLSFPSGTGRIVDVAAGSSFSVALNAAGNVYSWGKNDHGQLGSGTTNTSPYPVQVPQGLGKPLPTLLPGAQVALDAGREFAVYVVASGASVDVYTWGRGDSYQLGNGSTTDQKSPVKAASYLSTARVRALSAGGTHTLLLTTDGTLRTWGNNGLATAQSPVAVADPAAAIHSAVAVSAGDGASFVSSLDGTVAAWGSDTTGQLGRGVIGTVPAPTLVAIPGATPATLSGRAPIITSRQGETYVEVDAQITRGPDLRGHDFGQFATNPKPGQVAPSYVLSFPNVATKALASVSLATSGNTSDFTLSGSTCTGTLALDATCSVTVTFTPTAAGARSAVLTLSTTNTYGGLALVTQIPLTGTGYTSVTGVQNYALKLVGGATSTSGRGNVIDLKSLSPDLIPSSTSGTQAAGLPIVGKIPIQQAPLPIVGKIGLPIVGKIGLNIVGKIPLPIVGKIPLPIVGKIPLSIVGKIPLPIVGKIPLPIVGKIPLNTLGGWQSLLQDYPNLAKLPVSSLTLADLLNPALNQPANGVGPIFDRLTLGDVDIEHSVFKDVSAFAFLMGGTRLDQYSGVDWCSPTAQYPAGLLSGVTGGQATCTDSEGLHRTLFELSFLYKVNIGDLPLGNVTLGSIVTDSLSTTSDPLADAGFAAVVLNAPSRIAGTHFNVPLSSIPNLGAVVDCTKTDCTNLAGRHLGDSDVLAAIWPDDSSNPPVPTFRTLGSAMNAIPVGDVVEPFMDVSAFPWELLPKSSIPFQAYPGRVTYQADADVNCLQASGVTLGFTLPAGFDYVPGTTTLARTNGTGTVLLPDPAPVAGRGLVVSIPNSSFGGTGALACPNDGAHVTVRLSALPADTPSSALKASGDIRTTGGLVAAGTENDGGLTVTGAYAPPDASPDGPLGAADTLIFGSITTPGQVQYVPFTATPGQVVEATLNTEYLANSGKHDLDLVLYDPVGASAERSLTGPAYASPFGETPSDSLFNANGGSLQDLPRLGDRVIGAVSAGRGNDGEQLSAIARAGNDTRHVIQVSGYDGGTGAYTLRLRITDPPSLGPCTSAVPPMAGSAPTNPLLNASGFAGNEDTLVLVNTQRLAGAFGADGQAAVLSAADAFAHASSTHGQVVQLDSSADVRNAYAAWDAAPCDPTASNAVVQAITAFVRSLNPPTSIRYVTLVGSHDMIPYTWLEDRTRDGNEREEATDLAFTGSNPLAAAEAAGYYASDDPYGTTTPISVLDQLVYLPQWAVGRLGESQSDIVGQLQRFVANGGLADPHSASTRSAVLTDYDFLSRSGDATSAALTAAGYSTTHDLSGASAAWTKAQLDAEWLGKADPPDVAVLNMHYDQYRALPAHGFATSDLTDLYTANQVQSGPSLDRRVVFTVGCHSALGVPDAYNPAPVAGELNPAVDFAQSYAGHGAAVMVGNLGFGFADGNTIAYSARLQQLFAQGFSTTSSLGAALASAKRSFVGQFAALSPYDLKAAQEMVLWGLPQYRVPSSTDPVTPPPATTTVDPITGLTSVPLHVPTTVNAHQGDAGTSTYFSASGPGGTDQTVSVSGHPILGAQFLDLPDIPGKVLRSVVPRSLTSQERGTVLSTFAQAGVDSAGAPAPLAKGDFPSTRGHAWSIPTATGVQNTLVYTPEQVHLDGSAPGVGSVRTFSDSSWVGLYVDASTPEAVPDTIGSTSAVQIPDGYGVPAATSYSVSVTTPAGAATTSVYVLGLPAQAGSAPVAWHLTQLAQDSADPTHYTGGDLGAVSEYVVVATNSLGASALSTNKGAGWPTVPLTVDPGTARSHVSFNASPTASGWYTAAPLTMTLANGYTARVNGSPVSGSSYTFLTDGVYVVEVFDSSGHSLGAFPVFLDTVVPVVQVRFDPSAFSTVGSEQRVGLHRTVPATLNVIAGASGLSGAPQLVGLTGNATDGYAIDTGTVNINHLVASATSVAGLTGTYRFDYRVVYGALSHGFLAPTVAPPQSNTAVAGLTYGFSFHLADLGGADVTDEQPALASKTFTSDATGCTLTTNLGNPGGSPTAQPTYTGSGGDWQWNITIPSTGFGVPCQQLTLIAADGVTSFVANLLTVSV